MGFRLPKLTSASIPTDPRNKPVCHLFYTIGVKHLKKGSKYEVIGHMAMANSHVICACARQIYFTGCTENLLDARKILLDARLMQGKFTGCMAVASAGIIRAHTLHGANSWSVKNKKKIHAS